MRLWRRWVGGTYLALAGMIALAACATQPQTPGVTALIPANSTGTPSPAPAGPSRLPAASPTPCAPASAAASAMSSSAPLATLGPTRLGRMDNFTLVGQAALDGRGWNAGLALAYPCAYIGNRRLPGVAIVDISDPAHPRSTGQIALAPGIEPAEVRAVPDLGLLVVLNFSPALSVLTFDIHDCANPRPAGSLALGSVPHEFYLWRDPAQPARVLAYFATWGGQPDLLVVDVSDPANPRLAGSWTAAAAGVAGPLHSLSLSSDGQRAYLALWNGGFLAADSSDFALGRPGPRLRVSAPPGGPAPLPGQHLHSAVPLPGGRYVFLTQEVYTCPFAGALVADIADPARPVLAGRFDLPENDPGCAGLPEADAIFTAHNPLSAGPLVFVTWYGGGLQALDVRDPAHITRTGLFVPDASGPAGPSPYGRYAAQLWSYPILRQGLLYVSDIQRGLFILRYTGPEAAAVNAIPLAEGNASRPP